jgi:integrase
MSEEKRPRRERLTTVGDVIKTYLNRTAETCKGNGPRTCRRILEQFAAAKGDISMEEVIGDDLEEYIESQKQWKSGHTRRRGASTIKKAFSWAMKKGYIRAHPFAGISYRMGSRRPPMTEAQFRALVRVSTAEFRRVLYWLWWTGSRPAEMRLLKWDMINVEIGAAVLQEHKTAHSRADREPRVIYLCDKALRLLTWIL